MNKPLTEKELQAVISRNSRADIPILVDEIRMLQLDLKLKEVTARLQQVCFSTLACQHDALKEEKKSLQQQIDNF